MSTPQFAPPAGNEVATPATSNRVPRCFALRTAVCASDGFIPAPPQIDNGDEARYADKCGTYAKCILQGTIGRVDVAAYRSFKKALNSGKPADFANIVLGGPRTLNGPQGAWHSTWRASIAPSSPFPRHPHWRASYMPPNSWNSTGPRCCGISPSRLAPTSHSSSSRIRAWVPCRSSSNTIRC